MQGSAFLAFSPCYRGECRLLWFLLSLLSLEKSYHREELQILPNLQEYSLSVNADVCDGNVGVIFNGVDCFNNFIQFYCIVAVRFVYSSHIDRKINKRAPFFFSDFRGFHLGSQECELWNRGWLWV